MGSFDFDRRDTSVMSLHEIERYGVHLLNEYDLTPQGWSIAWDARAQRRLGQCRYREREIGLSKPNFTRIENRYLADNTIRHEIAHALVGGHAGHGPAWQAMCRLVGAEPRTCAEVAVPAAGAWLGRCACNPAPAEPYVKFRLPKGRTFTCRRCGTQVEWRKS